MINVGDRFDGLYTAQTLAQAPVKVNTSTLDQKIWLRVVCRMIIWLTVEIWLNFLGLDDLADYSEFIFELDSELEAKNQRTVKVTEYPPEFCSQIDDFCPIPGAATKPQDLEENCCTTKAEIFKHKCQQLAKPCLKSQCLTVKGQAPKMEYQLKG